MSGSSTSAIILRRVEYGDYDLILSFLTVDKGKISAIAKSAKKSTKRFAGVLEQFSILQIVCSTGRRKGLPVLQEAVLVKPFPGIRADIEKTAYASYWAELIDSWSEEGQHQEDLFRLFHYVLVQLDQAEMLPAVLSIVFQLRLLKLSGYRPNLGGCILCRRELDRIEGKMLYFDLSRGGLICDQCDPGMSTQPTLSKGTIKQLLWIEREALSKVDRIRFSRQALDESLNLLEEFVPYHLGQEPRSLTFLKQIR